MYVRGAILAIGMVLVLTSNANMIVTSSTVNERLGYKAIANGDPTSPQGVVVKISAERASDSDYGGVVFKTPAQPWTNQVVRVSALLETESPDAKPWLWLRADGESGKSLKFATSAGRYISDDGRTSIDLRIPPDTASVAFGIAMHGNGTTLSKDLRIEISSQVFPGGDASAQQVYDGALKIVLDNAYRSRNLPKSVRDHRPELSAQPGSGYQAEKEVRALLHQLQDSHSIYVTAEEAHRYSNSGGRSGSASVALIGPGVGYVLMPAFGGTDPALAKRFATEVGEKLRAVSPSAHCGWVVDLRSNTGGNMWPMVSALGIFFGDERLGGFKAKDGDINWWSLRSRTVTAVEGRSEARGARIAVLLGPRTASSGEAVAVAFIGRARTRSFGTATSGKASSNRKYPLPDGSAIYLTTAVDVDRNGREVGERIDPDTLLPAEVVSSDDAPTAALDWLTASCQDLSDR